MDRKLLEGTIEGATRELEDIGAEIARLQARRKVLLEYVRVSWGLLDPEAAAQMGLPGGAAFLPDVSGLADKPTVVRPPPPLPRGSEGDLDPEARTQRRSERRRYLQGLVDQSVDLLRRIGRPMNIDEIHAAHPERLNVSRDLLYHTVYKRQKQGRQLSLDRGYFWILGEELPRGWVHPLPPGLSHMGRPRKTSAR